MQERDDIAMTRMVLRLGTSLLGPGDSAWRSWIPEPLKVRFGVGSCPSCIEMDPGGRSRRLDQATSNTQCQQYHREPSHESVYMPYASLVTSHEIASPHKNRPILQHRTKSCITCSPPTSPPQAV